MKRLHTHSQNFLRSPQLVKRLVGHTNIGKNDDVLDIGAGSGVISSVLAGVAKSVTAIEADARFVGKLRDNLGAFAHVKVQQADILQLRLPRTPYKVFANIPFSLSSPIVQKLTDAANPPQAAYLIVQEQFARKLLPDNKGYTNQLGIALGAEFAVRIRQRLKPEDFYPRPNVPTVLIEIMQRQEPLLPRTQLVAYRRFVAEAFADPRTLWQSPLHQAGLPALALPSRLTLDQWVKLFSVMQSSRTHGLSLIDVNDPLLKQKAAPVAANEFTSPSLRFVADRLRTHVRGSNFAVAAPRIGVLKRIVALGDGGRNSLVLVNPVVRGNLITGQDHTGKPVTLHPTGKMLEATLREIASLDGRQS
jgi:16S rRNA A1518/A1519 N6-dimethyltransferase RsmA/KsgA/DIM1 with predicted DNA glycosylase/AP lyase activity